MLGRVAYERKYDADPPGDSGAPISSFRYLEQLMHRHRFRRSEHELHGQFTKPGAL